VTTDEATLKAGDEDRPNLPKKGVARSFFKSPGFDFIVGIVSQAMLVGSGLIMLPFAVTRLTEAQLGIWYIYLTVQGIVFLLDLGASQTFVRYFGYVFAGAVDLKDDEVPCKSPDGRVNAKLLAALLGTARRIYLCMAVVAGILMLTAGSYCLHRMTKDVDLPESIWPSWIVFVITMLAQTYYQWQGPPLIGSGRTRRNYEIAVVSRSVQVTLSVLALMVHPSLLAMSFGFAASAIVMRLDYHRSLRPIRDQVQGVVWPREQFSHLAGVVLRSARQLAGMVAGVQLTSRFIVLAVAWYAGLAASAQFSITYQALVALNSIAFVAQTMFNPKAARARVAGDHETMRSLFSLSLGFGWIVFAVGGAALILLVPYLLELIGSNTSLPSMPIILLMIAIFTFEMNMFTATHMITTSDNTVPYWKSMLASGALTVLAVIAVGELGLGLFAILITQFVIQLGYNYWRWPAYCFKVLGMRAGDIPRYALLGLKQARLK
jgi:hypothetical protein